MKKLFRFIKDPFLIIFSLGIRGYLFWLPDALWLKIVFRRKMGYKLNLNNPKTFNEKLQWLKLHDRKPHYTTLVDKYEVRKFIADTIGEEYLIPLLGVWDKFDDIDFDKLPNQFVLKCTHDSGGLIICKDKSKLDIKAAKKKINTSLKRNYYWYFREWPYKNVKPRIIAEKYMVDGNNIVPEDFKVYCINEEPKYIVIFHNRFNKNKVLAETVYDTDLNIIDCSFSEHFKAIKQDFPYPEAKDLLLKLSKFLSAGFRQIRTDFYIINGKIYFGELTLYTASGLTHFVPNEWDIKLGNLLNLGIENHE